MAEFAALAAIAILVPAALALLMDWLWPKASTGWLALLASIILPLALTLLLAEVYLDSRSHAPNPDHIDAGMVPAIAAVVGPILVILVWAFGFPAAYETLERRRRKREQ